jgi:hypothetical protein
MNPLLNVLWGRCQGLLPSALWVPAIAKPNAWGGSQALVTLVCQESALSSVSVMKRNARRAS